MNTNFRIAALAALVLLGACSDSSSPPRTNDAIRGRVLDAEGLPVAGASIMLQHEGQVVPDKPRLGISFTLPEAGPATVWVASYCDEDTVRMLVDGDLDAGQHTFIWDGQDDLDRLVPDGVYRFHTITSAGHTESSWALFRLGYADLPAGTPVAAQATTDNLGHFSLAQDCLPFGHTYEALAGPEAITRRVRVWALHPDFVTGGSDWVTVDAEDGAEATITLAR